MKQANRPMYGSVTSPLSGPGSCIHRAPVAIALALLGSLIAGSVMAGCGGGGGSSEQSPTPTPTATATPIPAGVTGDAIVDVQ